MPQREAERDVPLLVVQRNDPHLGVERDASAERGDEQRKRFGRSS